MNQPPLYKLEIFDGPLDLLLHLIHKNKLNISDIPINLITTQYLEYMNQMENMNLEITGEFVVMASELLYIKSKMLLPVVKEQDEEEDPREDLVNRLLEHKRMKERIGFLRTHQYGGIQHYFKGREKLSAFKLKIDKSYTLHLDELLSAYADVAERFMHRKPPKERVFSQFVAREKVSVAEKSQQIEEILADCAHKEFYSLMSIATTRAEMVACFIAILELIKMGRIFISFHDGKAFLSIAPCAELLFSTRSTDGDTEQ